MSKFVHLHQHDHFSTLDGINRTEEVPKHIKELGMESCAQTNHGVMTGSYAFFNACKKEGIRPLLGIEAYYTVTDRSAKEKDSDGENYYHLILIAQNNIGLKNLFKLSSKAYTEGMYRKPRCDDKLLIECSEGVLCTTACMGSRYSWLFLNNRRDEAERLIDHHSSIFKDRFFAEVQLHNSRDQQIVNLNLIDIAKKKNIPLVLTQDSHYTTQADKLLHEQALCMQTKDVMYNPKRFSFGDIDVHLASHDWMAEQAAIHYIPYEAISNTNYVASLVNDKDYFSDTKNRYPTFKSTENIPSYELLEEISKNNLEEIFGGLPPKEYRDRLNMELKVIKKMGFSDYLLIVQDFIKMAEENNIWHGPGRGSAAGSLVCYSLGITQVDPVKYQLLFERFLNSGRSATPLIF